MAYHALKDRAGAEDVMQTTLLRLLCGSLTPQGGSITGLPAEGIAMVFQEDRLLPSTAVTFSFGPGEKILVLEPAQ